MKRGFILFLLITFVICLQAQTQKVVFNYTPTKALVLIGAKSYKGDGHIELTLPVGTYNYLIAADGYETVEGSFKLNESVQRTITENLVSLKPLEPIITFDVNGVSFNMICVEGGTFRMGGTEEQLEPGSVGYDEFPVHEVTLSTYYIGETEVTQELWQAIMGTNPSFFKGERLPVESVSWFACQEFIEKLNQQTGRTFRLPTEAQWEFAARGGLKGKGYPYSGSKKAADVAWYSPCKSTTHEVKTKLPNELGIYDMAGNVSEWCYDIYGDYYNGPAQLNPTGPLLGDTRVFRGGAWSFNKLECRSANRYQYIPQAGKSDRGFRLVLIE